MKATIFKNITTTWGPNHVSIDECLERIRNGTSKQVVEHIRNTPKAERGPLKAKLPSVCFSGTFKYRNARSIINHSGFICLDFDDVGNVQSFKDGLKKDKFIFACWVSPGGDGIKALVKIPDEKENHGGYFDSLKEYYNLQTFDDKCRDVCRVAYESYDPDIYINRKSEVYKDFIEKEEILVETYEVELPIQDHGQKFEILKQWMEKKGEMFTPGNLEVFLFKLSSSCNRAGIPRDVAEYMIRSDYTGAKQSTYKTAFNSGYKKTSDFGKYALENKQAITRVKAMISSGRNVQDVKNYLVDNEKLEAVEAEKYAKKVDKQFKTKIETFWRVDFNPEKNSRKIIFKFQDYIQFLQDNGFFLYRPGVVGWIIIRITDNICSKVAESKTGDYERIKKFILEYIDSLPSEFDFITRDELHEFVLKNHKQFFSDSLFEFLEIGDLNWSKDKIDKAYYYFQNCVVQVAKEEIKEIEYSSLDGIVWDTHILPRVWIGVDEWKNDFQKFVYNVCAQDESRADKLEQIIGYLLHGFKNDAFAPVVILNDEAISDHPEGGTGKGIFVKGIREFKKTVVIDGKNWGFEKSFAFQRVDMDTQIIAFEDIKKKFDFEKLFSIVTEGLSVEKKNKSEFFIAFEDGPKLIITTNYPVSTKGNSNERRKIDVEFSQHYNSNHTPLDDFGRLLFKDWDQSDYSAFDKYMMRCVQKYLTNGPVIEPPKSVNLDTKKFIADTCPEFADWSAVNLQPNLKYNRDLIKEDFLNIYPDQEKWTTTRTFNKWLKSFADFIGYEAEESRSGNIFYITFNVNTDENEAGYPEIWDK